jgi:PAS domain S-box-containing protein
LPDKDKQVDNFHSAKDSLIEKISKNFTDSLKQIAETNSISIRELANYWQKKEGDERQSQERRHSEIVTNLQIHHSDNRDMVHALKNLSHSLTMQKAMSAAWDSSHTPGWTKTIEGYITSWNSASEKVLGWNKSEILGKSVYSRIVPHDKRKEEEGLLAKVGTGEKIKRYQTVRLHKDGRRIDVTIDVEPTIDEHGRVVGATTTIIEANGA